MYLNRQSIENVFIGVTVKGLVTYSSSLGLVVLSVAPRVFVFREKLCPPEIRLCSLCVCVYVFDTEVLPPSVRQTDERQRDVKTKPLSSITKYIIYCSRSLFCVFPNHILHPFTINLYSYRSVASHRKPGYVSIVAAEASRHEQRHTHIIIFAFREALFPVRASHAGPARLRVVA